MATAKFYLKNPKVKESSIFLIFNFNYAEIDPVTGEKKYRFLKYGIGEIIPVVYWDDKKCRAKETKKFPEYPEFNQRLTNYEQTVKDVYRQLLNDSIQPTPELIKQKLDIIFREPARVILKLHLLDFIREYIPTANRHSSTKEKYQATLKVLEKYQEHISAQLDFDSISLKFYDDFIGFLQEEKYAANTVGSHIKNIKVFMNIALDRGLTTNRSFQNRRFKVIAEESESIYLSKEEITKIYDLDLSNNTRLDKIRDLFVVGCYTGLRFSDLSQIKKENFINGKTFLKLTTQKTGEVVMIPLHDYVKEVCEKYNYEFPRVISNQKFNEYLKEIAKIAGIYEHTEVNITRGGKKEKTISPKNQLVTSHTARRSFATNAYLAGIPTISIMKITGHKTEKAFLKYIKITPEDNALLLQNHSFFNK